MYPTKVSNSITIAIADPYELIRKGLCRTLQSQENFDVIWDVDNCEALRKNLLVSEPNIIIMELQLNGMCVFESLKWIKADYPKTLIIILTRYKTDLTQIRLFKDGVRAILNKNISEDSLFMAIGAVIHNGFYYTDTVSRNIFNFMYNEATPIQHQRKLQQLLSEREWTFIKFTGSDLTYDQIASIMKLSAPVLNKIRNQLFDKLEVTNRSQLAALALENGIKENVSFIG